MVSPATVTYTSEQMVEFFNDVQGYSLNLKNKDKMYNHPLFKLNWGFKYFRHICVSGGTHHFYGMLLTCSLYFKIAYLVYYVGGIHDTVLKSIDGIPLIKWNRGKSGNQIRAIQEPHRHYEVTMLKGTTLFAECAGRHLWETNPTHFLMKVGFFYELAKSVQNKEQWVATFDQTTELPFTQLYMHQCVDADKYNWTWGKLVWDVIKGSMASSGIYAYNRTQEYAVGVNRDTNFPKNPLTCFEDVYMSHRLGTWIASPEYNYMFRQDLHQLVYKSPLPPDDTTTPAFCQTILANQPSPVRIAVFKRATNDTRRARGFLNLDEVLSGLQTLSTLPVHIITVDESTPVQTQIEKFNSFDLIITGHGSHIANTMFTNSPKFKGVIEVASVLIDPIFRVNIKNDVGFFEYIISNGHFAPSCGFDTPSSFAERGCLTSAFQDEQSTVHHSWIVCDKSINVRSCMTLVNMTLLLSQVQEYFHAVCTIPRA